MELEYRAYLAKNKLQYPNPNIDAMCDFFTLQRDCPWAACMNIQGLKGQSQGGLPLQCKKVAHGVRDIKTMKKFFIILLIIVFTVGACNDGDDDGIKQDDNTNNDNESSNNW